jgi:ankyrin repeat and BTB/POZ domain-containing protein 1
MQQESDYPDENPLKTSIIQKGFLEDKRAFAHDSSTHFLELCDAVRRGDLEAVQTWSRERTWLMSRLVANFGVDINRTDEFDASPLMLASLCGHGEVVQYLLDSGAILDRHSFQGERYILTRGTGR